MGTMEYAAPRYPVGSVVYVSADNARAEVKAIRQCKRTGRIQYALDLLSVDRRVVVSECRIGGFA